MNDVAPAPVVSIVMPLFNAEQWVTDTLSSIRDQRLTEWELIVVNDGSTDSGADLVAQFADSVPQSVVVVDIPNAGPSAARNEGIARSRGELVAFVDADDIWRRDKLRDQVDLLDSDPLAVAAICDYAIQEGIDGSMTAHRHFTWSDQSLQAWALMEDISPCLNSTLLVRRAVLHEIGGFRDEMTNVEDLDLAYRLERAGRVLSTGRKQMIYRMHPFQNHKNRSTIIRDYRVFLSQWTQVSDSSRRRGYASALLLEAAENWKSGHHGSALVCGTRSLREAPLQWARLLAGVRRRARKSRSDER